MTALDEIPVAPSCPVCGRNGEVQREGPQRRWVCGDCWTVFEGSQSEWESMRQKREAYIKRRGDR